MKSFTIISALVVVGFVLAGCGVKGPLLPPSMTSAPGMNSTP